MYLFETHIHTSRCSKCAKSSSLEMVDAAINSGYSGFVITNHFYRGNTCIDRDSDWKSFVNAYEEDYLEAKEYGLHKGVTVLFGIEEGYGNGKEVLIYGIGPETLINNSSFKDMDIYEMSAFVHLHGGILSAAHPFRNRAYITNPDESLARGVFDVIEGYNRGNPPEENEKAVKYARDNNLPFLSGGDVHLAASFGNAGVAFENAVTTDADFINAVKSGKFKIITDSQIQY